MNGTNKIIFLLTINAIALHATWALGSSSRRQLQTVYADTVFLSEGFNTPGVIPQGWSMRQIVGPTGAWTVVGMGSNPPILPYSGAGQAKFNSFDAGAGEQARLTSPVINLTRGNSPYLLFYMYHDNEFTSSLDSIYVEVSTVDSINGPWTILRGLRRVGANSGWQREAIPLSAFSGLSRVFIGLRGVSKFGNNMFVDEFSIGNVSFHDIGAVGLLTGPMQMDGNRNAESSTLNRSRLDKFTWMNAPPTSRLEPIIIVDRTQPLAFNVIVQNFGTFAEGFYQIGWKVDDFAQTSVINSGVLPPNGRDTLELNWLAPFPGTHMITAWTSLSEDSNHTNDTARLTIQVIDSSVVFSETFNGPVFPPPGWIVINRDGGTLAPWFLGTSISPFTPFEGSGFAADNFQRANGNYLDDYLITPPVSGIGASTQYDSLVFWCRSMNYPPPNPNYPDSLMILLSTTGVDTSNFTIFLDYFSVPKTDWRRRAYKLTGRVPSNSTVRVAFRYLLYNVQPASGSGDFIGIDAVQFSRGVPVSVEHPSETPTTFALKQNFPNPFNPLTRIRFTIASGGLVRLNVYDILGRLTTSLVNEKLGPGVYEREFDASALSSGTYICRLDSGGQTQTRMMLLVK